MPSDRSAPEEAELASLVRRIATGDEAALASFYDTTRTLVFGFARHVLADEGAAEEATLDVYQQVWRDARRFDLARGSVVSWLMNLTRSRAIDRLRAAGAALRRLEQPLEAAQEAKDAVAGPDEASWIQERRERIAAALAQLPKEQEVALRAAFFLGLSHSEVAAALKQPLGTIKTRIRTGLLRLRDQLLVLEANA